MEFTTIALTDNEALNYFFSFPIYVMFISLVPLAILNLIKKL